MLMGWEAVPAEAVSTFSQSKEKKMIKAKDCQNLFNVITKNANEIGMKVNKEKTQLNNTETPQQGDHFMWR